MLDLMLVLLQNEVEKSSNENIGFNAATGEYVDMFEAGIVDPAKVEKSCNAKCCFSSFITSYN